MTTSCGRFERERFLERDEEGSVQAHLASCAACASVRASYDRLIRLMASQTGQRGPVLGWEARVLHALDQPERARPRRLPWWAAALACAVVAAVFIMRERTDRGERAHPVTVAPPRSGDPSTEPAVPPPVPATWCDVVGAWDRLRAGYPFTRGPNVRDVPIAALEEFLRPRTGIVWTYYAAHLARDIERAPGTSAFRVRGQAPYRPTLLAFLSKAQALTDALFRGQDPGKIYVPVEVRLHPAESYHRIMLVTGSRKLVYQNGAPEWGEVLWPATGAYLIANAGDQATTVGNETMEWGMFHLLDGAAIRQEGDYLAARIASADHLFRFDVKPVSLATMFTGMDPPRSLTAASPACPAAPGLE